jgi:hypothetical protein
MEGIEETNGGVGGMEDGNEHNSTIHGNNDA